MLARLPSGLSSPPPLAKTCRGERGHHLSRSDRFPVDTPVTRSQIVPRWHASRLPQPLHAKRRCPAQSAMLNCHRASESQMAGAAPPHHVDSCLPCGMPAPLPHGLKPRDPPGSHGTSNWASYYKTDFIEDLSTPTPRYCGTNSLIPRRTVLSMTLSIALNPASGEETRSERGDPGSGDLATAARSRPCSWPLRADDAGLTGQAAAGLLLDRDVCNVLLRQNKTWTRRRWPMMHEAPNTHEYIRRIDQYSTWSPPLNPPFLSRSIC